MCPEGAFVFINLPYDALIKRFAGRRDTPLDKTDRQLAGDKKDFADIEKNVDLALDGRMSIEDSVQEIIQRSSKLKITRRKSCNLSCGFHFLGFYKLRSFGMLLLPVQHLHHQTPNPMRPELLLSPQTIYRYPVKQGQDNP